MSPKSRRWSTLFDRAVDRFGRVDLLFNNAGTVAPPCEPDEITPAEWHAHRRGQPDRRLPLRQGGVPGDAAQQPRGGRIINNGSISAYVPRVSSMAYTATKHAITGLTRSLSLDGRPYDIACGQIDIGNAATDHTARGSAERHAAAGRQVHARADHATSRDVARAVVFMASLPLNANVAAHDRDGHGDAVHRTAADPAATGPIDADDRSGPLRGCDDLHPPDACSA